MTQSIRNQLGPNCIDIDTRYETSIESFKTQYNSVKLGELERVPEMTRLTRWK